MKPALIVIKIGGVIIDRAADLHVFLRQFAETPGAKLLVHGGGKGASEMMRNLGLAPQLVDGRRVTDAAALDIVTMVYAGKINKQIVAALQHHDVNAIGISGPDGDVIRAVKRPVQAVDYGFVGDLGEASVNANLLHQLLCLGLTPVLCPITHDGYGQLLNTNADTIAAAVAKALSPQYAVELHFCFEKQGVLADASDEQSVIARITLATYANLKMQGIITDGMLPKLESAFEALRCGVGKVIIEHALRIHGDVKTVLCLY